VVHPGTGFIALSKKEIMAKEKNNGAEEIEQGQGGNTASTEGPETPSSMDDSASDEERLKQETSFVVLPEVQDIPGQENITGVAPFGELADTTASSDDEEGMKDGKDILAGEDDDDELEIVMGTEADVTDEDLVLLGEKDKDMDMGDDEMLHASGLDDTDLDGEPLNETDGSLDTTGDDLDIPEADEDNPANNALGQGDEENNYYSLGSDDNDNLTEGTP